MEVYSVDLIEKLSGALEFADSLDGLDEDCLDAVETLYDTLCMLEEAEDDTELDDMLPDAIAEIRDALDVFAASNAPQALISALEALL